MLGVALALILAQQNPPMRFYEPNATTRAFAPSPSAVAYVEFAPASGAGLGSACACLPVTDRDGAGTFFKRLSGAVCSKRGLAVTGIQPGDYVVCDAGIPRVEPTSSGALGVRIEPATSNTVTNSQEMSTAPWSSFNTIAALPTLNAVNTIRDPFDTTTGEDFSFPSTGTGGNSVVSYPGACSTPSSAQWAVHAIALISPDGGVGLQDDGGYATGTIDLCCNPGVYGSSTCTSCSITSASWTRCVANKSLTSNGTCWVGNDTLFNGGVARPAIRVGLNAASCQGITAQPLLSYFRTSSGAGVTYGGDVLSMNIPAAQQYGALAASVEFASQSVADQSTAFVAALGDGTDMMAVFRSTSADAGFRLGTTTTTPFATIGTGVVRALVSSTDAGVRSAYWGGASLAAPAGSLAAAQTRLYIGTSTDGGSGAGGIVTQVCFAPLGVGCAP